jgi:hypothetical protein
LPAATAVAEFGNAPDRYTTAYLSVNPKTVGLNQDMLVNLWIYPSPSDAHLFSGGNNADLFVHFHNITVTFTRPDGTTDTFMPVDGSGGVGPGESESIGAIWFQYKPNQIGNWTVMFTYPGDTFVTPPSPDTVYYKPCTSPPVPFTVQSESVQIGLPPAALPTGYWDRPVSAENREWYQISGDWLQLHYNGRWIPGNCFNPYTTGPESGHILWKREIAMGGLVGGVWGGYSYAAQGGTAAPIVVAGKVYINRAGNVFDCVDLRTGELLWEQPGAPTLGHSLIISAQVGTQMYAAAAPTPYLWDIGSATWKKYDPMTGALVGSFTNAIPPTSLNLYFGSNWFEGSPVVFCLQQSGWNTTLPNQLAVNRIIRWQ